MQLNKIYGLEWSPQQQTFHIDDIVSLAKHNREVIERGEIPEWFLVSLGTWDECFAAEEGIREEHNPHVVYAWRKTAIEKLNLPAAEYEQAIKKLVKELGI